MLSISSTSGINPLSSMKLLCRPINVIDEFDHGLPCGIELCESWKLPADHQAQGSGIERKSRHTEHLSKKW
jgi:hypothetical protein